MDWRSSYERRRDELHKEWVRLGRQKPLAWLFLIAASAGFISNYREVVGPFNGALGGVTLICILGCFLWLWMITREQDRINRLSVENDKDRH